MGIPVLPIKFRKHLLVAGMLLLYMQAQGQQYNIYPGDKPDIVSVWQRVADYAPVLRSVESARISPDGRFAVSASKFGYNLMMWKVADGSLLWEKKETAEIECLVFSPDGSRFASGHESQAVKIWDVKTGKELKTLQHDSSLDGITWSHDGTLIAAGSEKGDVWLWNAQTYGFIEKVNVGSTVNSLDFSKDDSELIVGGNLQAPDIVAKYNRYGGFVKLIDVKSRKVLRDYPGVEGSVKSVRISADGKFVAYGGFDMTVQLYDKESGKRVKTFVQPLKVEAVAFTPDNQYLVVGGHTRSIDFIRLKDFEVVMQMPSPRTEYIDFSADGRLLLTAHEDSGLIGLYLMISTTHNTPGLYQKIEEQILDNPDVKGTHH